MTGIEPPGTTGIELPDEIVEFRQQALEFIRKNVHPFEQRVAESGVLDRDEYESLRRHAEEEIPLPDGYGHTGEADGPEVSMVVHVAIEEIAGHVTNGLYVVPRARGRNVFGGIASEFQRQKYVVPTLRGEMRHAWAITEPGSAGSDVKAISATAVRDGEAWRLNGEKWFVTGGDRAAYFLVLVWAAGEQALFIVDRDAPGLEIVRRPQFMHDPHPSGHVELRLQDCPVPDENRVPAGEGGTRRWISVERLMIAARCCGAAERLIDETTQFVKERTSFGRTLIEHQGVEFPLADSVTELLAARLLTYHAAEACDSHPDPKIIHGKIAIAKLYASEMANRVADRCLQLYGGRGYMNENVANRYFRELRVDRIWEGTSEIQRSIIGRGLAKRGRVPYTALLPNDV
jgi:alkylation response protein AidB-like acyl-CoA dehydrogenase